MPPSSGRAGGGQAPPQAGARAAPQVPRSWAQEPQPVPQQWAVCPCRQALKPWRSRSAPKFGPRSEPPLELLLRLPLELLSERLLELPQVLRSELRLELGQERRQQAGPGVHR